MRRQYAGAAFPSVLTSELAASTSALTILCDDLTNWPDGTVGPFYVVIDRGLATEEKILCVTRSANSLSVYNDGITNGRGADGTSISYHGPNSVIEHVFTATDADEANLHVNSTGNVHGITGNVVGTSDTQTLTNKTLTSPTINSPTIAGGTITAGTISVTGPQALDSFRNRNTYVAATGPTAGDGNDGDMWLVYS